MKKIIFFITSNLNIVIHLINQFFDDMLDIFNLNAGRGVGWLINEFSWKTTWTLSKLEYNLEEKFELKHPLGNGTYLTDDEEKRRQRQDEDN